MIFSDHIFGNELFVSRDIYCERVEGHQLFESCRQYRQCLRQAEGTAKLLGHFKKSLHLLTGSSDRDQEISRGGGGATCRPGFLRGFLESRPRSRSALHLGVGGERAQLRNVGRAGLHLQFPVTLLQDLHHSRVKARAGLIGNNGHRFIQRIGPAILPVAGERVQAVHR